MRGFEFLKPHEIHGEKRVDLESLNATIYQNRLLWMLLITQQPIPISRFANAMKGDKIGAVDNYQLLYENKGVNPVGVRIYADFGDVPGRQIKISLSNKKDDSDVVEFLGNTADAPSFNKRLSDTIVVMPQSKLWVNGINLSAFPLDVNDTFRVRVFDPGEFIASRDWELR